MKPYGMHSKRSGESVRYEGEDSRKAYRGKVGRRYKGGPTWKEKMWKHRARQRNHEAALVRDE